MDLAIRLDSNAPIPLHRQLYEELRRAILTGRLSKGKRIPSTRALAKSLGISRTTVTLAYEQLISEGYMQTTVGSGTFVCSQLPDELLNSAPLDSFSEESPPAVQLSNYGAIIANTEIPYYQQPDLPISFRYGQPAFEQFPFKLWRKLLSRHCGSPLDWLHYATDAGGYKPLREAIASYLARSRAVQCEPDQIIITSGSQQALDLVTRLLIAPGDGIALEEPGYPGARYIFLAQGAKLYPMAVDESGLVIEKLVNSSQKNIKLLYITPSHQFPTGAVLSLPRRLALLAWAQKMGTMIIEDDYDSEYRYGERPIPALQGLAHSNSVLYIGTFSKMLFPSLRIGYLVVPQPLVNLLTRAKWLTDRHSPLLEQKVLVDFLNEGHLESYIRRMRNHYNQLRQVLVQALRTYLAQKVTILGEKAGIHVMVRLNTKLSDEEIIDRAAELGVCLVTAQPYYLENKPRGEFIFGYAQLTSAQIQEGISKLALIVTE
ncbi:MAG: PLP-dependent aminotransferase family protein [Symploca sp. SIO2D2]|nr:PLP-dependent aminotransferase family protein [Symploca sp. SIO2D2]